MTDYEQKALAALQVWEQEMQRSSGLGERLARGIQTRVNRLIPEKIHRTITTVFKGFTEAVLTGSNFITRKPVIGLSLEERDEKARRRVKFYKNAAMAEGAATGAGGILLGLADLPLWLTLKTKMLFDLAALYGIDTSKRTERVFILRVLMLGFSSRNYRKKTFEMMYSADTEPIDWRRLQQEYRDSIDLPKMLQLVPGIGAFVGASVNLRLTEKLGELAIQAFHKRFLERRPTTTAASHQNNR